MSFVASSENLVNPFTYPLVHLLVNDMRQSGEPNWDVGVGIVMYPVMAINSGMWSLGLALLVSWVYKIVLSRHKKP